MQAFSVSKIKGQNLAFPLLLLCGVMFSMRIVTNKLVLDAGMQPVQLGIFGNFASALILLPLLIYRGEKVPMGKQHIALYLSLGLVSFALPSLLSFYVVTRVGAGYTASVFCLSPMLTMLLASIFGMERLFIKRVIAILVALIAVTVLLQQQFALIHFDQHLWVLVGLTIPLCAAIGNIIRSAFWPQGSSPISFSFATLIASSLMLIPVAPIIEMPSTWQFFSGHIIVLFALGAAISCLSFVLNYRLQALAGPVFFSQVGSVGTGFGIFFGALLFGEGVTFAMVAALIVIVIASQKAKAQSS